MSKTLSASTEENVICTAFELLSQFHFRNKMIRLSTAKVLSSCSFEPLIKMLLKRQLQMFSNRGLVCEMLLAVASLTVFRSQLVQHASSSSSSSSADANLRKIRRFEEAAVLLFYCSVEQSLESCSSQ